jgi:hypothetical protein
LSVGAWDQVPIGVYRHLDRRMPELVSDVRETLTILDQERRKRVP